MTSHIHHVELRPGVFVELVSLRETDELERFGIRFEGVTRTGQTFYFTSVASPDLKPLRRVHEHTQPGEDMSKPRWKTDKKWRDHTRPLDLGDDWVTATELGLRIGVSNMAVVVPLTKNNPGLVGDHVVERTPEKVAIPGRNRAYLYRYLGLHDDAPEQEATYRDPVEEEFANLEAELAASEARVEELEEEILTLRGSQPADRLGAARAYVSARYTAETEGARRQSIAAMQDDLDKERAVRKQLEAELASLRDEDLTRRQPLLDAGELAELDGLRRSDKALRGKVGDLEGQIASLMEASNHADAGIEALERMVRKKDERVAELEEQIKHFKKNTTFVGADELVALRELRDDNAAMEEELADLYELVEKLSKDAEENEQKLAELHHAPTVPKAVIEGLCQMERTVGYLAQCEAEGHDIGDALKHSKVCATELRKAAGWS